MPERRNALRQPDPALPRDEDIHFKQPTGPKTSGHEVDFSAFSVENRKFTPYIFKFNKHEGEKGVDASVHEVAFSQLALMYLRSGLTPPAKIVRGIDGEVIGVASENFNVQIMKLIEAGTRCYKFDPKNPGDGGYVEIRTQTPEKVEDLNLQQPLELVPEALELLKKEELEKLKSRKKDMTLEDQDIVQASLKLKQAKQAVNFLNEMPRGFIPDLMARNDVEVDMDSLASILTGSYFLEEDDLHKGNIGFYVTDSNTKDGKGNFKKKFTFFKIDHDLMLIDSIMSRKDGRPDNLFYNNNSFKITARDLEGFPDLKDSGNHYWPTKWRASGFGAKAYNDPNERQAFANLKDNTAFIAAKWNNFLKYSLIPKDLVKSSLTMHLDPKNDVDNITMIQNSIEGRMTQLKQALLDSPKFLEYLSTDAAKAATENIKKEIVEYMKSSNMNKTDQDKVKKEINDTFKKFVACAEAPRTTSRLAKTIMLDCYVFSSKDKIKEGDIGLAMYKFNNYKNAPGDDNKKNAFKYACIVVDLVAKSSDPETRRINLVQDFKKDYLKPESIKTFEDFKGVANKIRATDLPLKQQKKEILAVLKEAELGLEELQALRAELKKDMPDNSLKFINQLQSELWLVRKFRGTYGTFIKTRTSDLMVSEIDSQIAKLKATAVVTDEVAATEIDTTAIEKSKHNTSYFKNATEYIRQGSVQSDDAAGPPPLSPSA